MRITQEMIWTLASLTLVAQLSACGSDPGTGPLDGGTRDGAATKIDGGASIDGAAGSPDARASQIARCPAALPADWIFCDDFEAPNVAARYFEFSDDGGDFRRVATEAASGSYSMEVLWQSGEVSAGGMKVTFGRNPIGTQYRTSEDFTDIYWRMRVKHQTGWVGSPAKLSRATVFSASNWSQAMIAHLWSAGDVLLGDPAGCVVGGTVQCSGYNDFGNLDWLGQMPGTTPMFSTADAGRWRCVEGHLRLNTPGASDGVFEFWIDGNLESSRSNFDWRGTWTTYGINAVFFENYWNAGAGTELRRWFDDIVIATVPIGCD